jgi:hypothetical protein
MQEHSRLAYLDALGVVSWVPRERLVNAVARPMVTVEESTSFVADQALPAVDEAALVPEEPVEPQPSVDMARVRKDSPAVDKRASSRSPSPGQALLPASPALAPFYLQLWLAGPCALLLEISEPGLEKATAPYRLLTDILRAAGLPGSPVLLADFQWPLTRNPQFDRSAVAASQALSAFVQARLEGKAVVSIGCLGQRGALLAEADPDVATRLSGREEALEGLAPVWFAASLEALLVSAGEKAKLWTLLKRVMPRWKER